jgi:hypothetical protein
MLLLKPAVSEAPLTPLHPKREGDEMVITGVPGNPEFPPQPLRRAAG